MPKYIIERTIPGASRLSPQQLQGVAQQSCDAIKAIGGDYHWLHSYVAGDKFYCVHVAPDEKTIREHSRKGCFPIDRIEEVVAIVDPSTADVMSPA